MFYFVEFEKPKITLGEIIWQNLIKTNFLFITEQVGLFCISEYLSVIYGFQVNSFFESNIRKRSLYPFTIFEVLFLKS